MILPDTDLIGATQIAEAARDAVARLRVPHERSPAAPHLTISGGVAVLPQNKDSTAQELIAAADEGLSQAKLMGRNRMVSVPGEPALRIASA
jgi:diguanylate cyclase (GGDEF)-like protein